MAYNGLSEIIEIALAKGLLKYRHNPLEYINKISTRVGVGLNMLSIGFDIYNVYDNFSQFQMRLMKNNVLIILSMALWL
ncbi:hypothetical protein AB6H17_16210 [Proteus vulgaris]|uniref:hypothetical protein n=1 Tax=Proteus vulgaris TaxID=585 RepID=UPI0034DD216A